MIILGIDPGTATTGFGVIRFSQKGTKEKKSSFSENQTRIKNLYWVDFGYIETSKDLEFPKRLIFLSKEVRKIAKIHQPDIAIIEKLFFFLNKKTAIKVSQAIGVLFLTLETLKIKIQEYPPLEVKKFITQDGRAEKVAMEENVCRMLKIKNTFLKKKCGKRKDDAIDALALAIYGAHKLNIS